MSRDINVSHSSRVHGHSIFQINTKCTLILLHGSQFTGRYQVKIADQGTVAANLGKMHS